MQRLGPDIHDNLFNAFIHHVQSTPDKTAIVYNDASITYKKFAENVLKIASLLNHHYGDIFNSNSDKQVLIGVMCYSKLHALYCEFAILALGAVFVPFLFNDAHKRQEFMISQAEVSLMLTDDNQYKINDSLHYCNVMELINTEANTEKFSYSNVHQNDLAYVLFTSGSTAQNPKGVMRTRSSLYNQMAGDYTKDLNITKEDCLLNLAIFTHDQAIVDCFAAILNGCTLCLYDPENLNVNHLHDFIKKNQISIFSSIPSMFSIIFENIKDKNTFPRLRIVTIGGEETLISHALLYQKTCPDNCVLINGYGATEISWVASYEINHKTDLTKLSTIPLGYMTESVKMKFMPFEDENNACESLKELCLISENISPSYLNDKIASSQAFFRDSENNYYYRSGDIVSLDENNCMHYMGRKNWHEKINGKRVNLHEIENAFQDYFKFSVVIAYGEGEKKKLYAFHTEISSGRNFNELYLRLEKLLEKHMIPQFFCMKEMPLLQNGKINRQALRELLERREKIFQVDLDKIKEMQSSIDIMKALEGFWREVLEIPSAVALKQAGSFHACGGSSQLAISLINKVNHYFKEKIGFSIQLSPLVLYQDGDTFEKFCHCAAVLCGKIKKQMQDAETIQQPEVQKWHISLAYHKKMDARGIKFYQGYFDGMRSKAITVVEYDHLAFKMLIKHFKELYKIDIRSCESHQDLVLNIDSFIKNPHSPSQIGLVLYSHHDVARHNFPAMLCKNKNNGEVFLLVADALQGFYCLKNSLPEIAKIKKLFPNLHVLFDLSGRQIDINSCSTDTLLYLIAAMQSDMLKHSLFPYITTLEIALSMGRDSFYCSSNISLPDELKRSCLFISPLRTFYHSQVMNVSQVANISKPCSETRTLLSILSQDSSMKKQKTGDCFFVLQDFDNNLYKISAKCNLMLWEKSYEFFMILVKIMEQPVNQQVVVNVNPRAVGFFGQPANPANTNQGGNAGNNRNTRGPR
jgi:acyl-coenzyme A synthetase/AMP-(fatty) acid ligase